MSHVRFNLQAIQKKSKSIETKARYYLKNGKGDHKIAYQWLDYRMIINMYRVCESFHDDRLHYATSEELHPFMDDAQKDYLETSLPSLEAVLEETSPRVFSPIARAYRIKKDEDAAKTLKMFLTSRTTGDCTSSICIAFLLTIYDVIQLQHGKKADEVFNHLFGSHRPLEERMTIGSFGIGLSTEKEKTLTSQ
ncbi:MAG TPA: hypothetical protein VHM20_06015, partial [Gammaproteobacteria bacterium]|nr:hypothetical protein [Gammaproteobacteria bacterium]